MEMGCPLQQQCETPWNSCLGVWLLTHLPPDSVHSSSDECNVGQEILGCCAPGVCLEHAAAGAGQMAYIEAHRGGLGQHRQGQVQKRCSVG